MMFYGKRGMTAALALCATLFLFSPAISQTFPRAPTNEILEPGPIEPPTSRAKQLRPSPHPTFWTTDLNNYTGSSIIGFTVTIVETIPRRGSLDTFLRTDYNYNSTWDHNKRGKPHGNQQLYIDLIDAQGQVIVDDAIKLKIPRENYDCNRLNGPSRGEARLADNVYDVVVGYRVGWNKNLGDLGPC